MNSKRLESGSYFSEPRETWTQSNEDVTMSLKIEGIRNEQLKNLDVQFSDTDVSISLAGILLFVISRA